MAEDTPFLTVHEDSSVHEEVLGASRVLRSKIAMKIMQTSVDRSEQPGGSDTSSVPQKQSKPPKARTTIDWKSKRVRLAFYGEVKK